MSFQIIFKIDNPDDVVMLVALNWFKDNYGGNIHQIQGSGDNKTLNGVLLSANYSDMVSALTALKTEFGERLTWNFAIRDIQ